MKSLARKQTVAVAEATSGGLITGKLLLLRTELSLQPYFRILHHLTFIVSDPKASLMGRSRASRFYRGSITIYTRVAGRELLPKDVRHKVFVKDYASELRPQQLSRVKNYVRFEYGQSCSKPLRLLMALLSLVRRKQMV